MPRTFLSLNVHIVFSTKNRQPLISEEIQPDLHAYLGGVTKTLGAAPMKVGDVADHVHLLIGIKGTHAVSDLVREIKKTSSSWVSERMRDRRFAWQEGFSAFSVSAERTSCHQIYCNSSEASLPEVIRRRID